MIKSPEYHNHEEFQLRTRKLGELKELGVEPYPYKYEPTNTAAELHTKHKDDPIGHSEDAAAGSTPSVRMAGRLVLFRAMGKNAFAHIQDETGRIQVMFNRDLTQVTAIHPKQDKDGELSPYQADRKEDRLRRHHRHQGQSLSHQQRRTDCLRQKSDAPLQNAASIGR